MPSDRQALPLLSTFSGASGTLSMAPPEAVLFIYKYV
jgi:hypothetical protein